MAVSASALPPLREFHAPLSLRPLKATSRSRSPGHGHHGRVGLGKQDDSDGSSSPTSPPSTPLPGEALRQAQGARQSRGPATDETGQLRGRAQRPGLRPGAGPRRQLSTRPWPRARFSRAKLGRDRGPRPGRGTVHFIGLLSDGNVHSHISQLYALLTAAAPTGSRKCAYTRSWTAATWARRAPWTTSCP